MLTILIAVAAGAAAGFFAYQEWGTVWGIICGFAVLLTAQFTAGLIVRKKVGALQQQMQQQLTLGQAKVERKLTMMQQRGSGDIKAARQMLEKEQNILITEALKYCDRFDAYNKWSPMLPRQINTMRFAFYFQMKNFKAADAISSKCMFFDAHSISMQLVRLYKNSAPNLDKFFRSKVRRLRGDNMVLPYCTYAWILLHSGREEEAVKLMVEAHGKSTHPVITENWERLVNGKVKQFNLSGLGEMWYSLYLEEPKIQKSRMGRQYI